MPLKIMEELIDFPGQSTLRLKFNETPFLHFPWHHHQEFEILYLLESTGTRFVGDNIEPFAPGDLVLLAGNIPHYWRNDDSYYMEGNNQLVKRVVLQFPGDFLATQLEHYPEFGNIKLLFQRAVRGIQFLPPSSEQLGALILDLFNFSGFKQMVRFLEILELMANSEQYKLLASEGYQVAAHDLQDDRLEKVKRYIMYNYQKNISLSTVAEKAGMHPTAFCRYFKYKTGKSLTTYINELRIAFGCKLLIKGHLQISQVCYDTGFNNVSNFNRIFKQIVGMTPTQYQDTILR